MTIDWFYIALLCPALWALVTIIDDNLIRTVYKNPYVGVIITGFFALVPLLSIFFVPITIPESNIIFLGLFGGFLLTVTSLFYFKALMIEYPSVVITLFGLTSIIVPILAYVFLGEILTTNEYIGFALVLGSSVGISITDIKKFKISKALYFVIFASVTYALSAVIVKDVYQQVDFWSGFLLTSAGIGVGALFFSLFFKEGRKFIKEIRSFKKYLWIFILSELINIIAVFSSNLAISRGSVSLVKVIEGTQPVFVLLFAILFLPFFPKFLREATHGEKRKKLLYMLIMIIGLYFIHSS